MTTGARRTYHSSNPQVTENPTTAYPAVQGYLTWYALEVGCRVSSLIEPDSLSEPVLCPFFVDFSGGDSDHRLLGLVEVGRVGISMTLVEINKEDQCCPCGAYSVRTASLRAVRRCQGWAPRGSPIPRNDRGTIGRYAFAYD